MSDITFSIVSHDHAALMRNLLQQISAAAALAGAPVIVTLNLAEEAFDPSDFPTLRITLIRNPSPKGFGANHNAAFANCGTRWFAILNPDLALAGSEPFTALAAKGAGIADIGVIAPRVLGADGGIEDSVRPNLSPLSLLRRHLLGREPAPDIGVPARKGAPFYWLAGMCLLADAGAFRAVGGFDERFFLYCEDYDLSARLYQAGYALVVDGAARITHTAQRSSRRSLRYLRMHMASLLRVWASRVYWNISLRS